MKTRLLRVTGLCVPGEFPAQMASNAENVSIWWRHHEWFKFPAARFMPFVKRWVLPTPNSLVDKHSQIKVTLVPS